MKALVALLVAVATYFVMDWSSASAREPIGTVLNAAQTVRAGGAQGTRVLTKNNDVFYLDRISANATGNGEFEFKDGTKLALGPGASLVVNESVLKSKSRFQKLSLSATRGAFRWISGGSASSAYEISTPHGTIGIRGTVLDVTIRNGRVYLALISGNAKFCNGSSCRTLKQSCDFIVVDGRKISEPESISKGFEKREAASQIFPFLADPNRLSSRFRVGGSCFSRSAGIRDGGKNQSLTSAAAAGPNLRNRLSQSHPRSIVMTMTMTMAIKATAMAAAMELMTKAAATILEPFLEQIPAKLHDPGSSPGQAFADKDLLQLIDLARFLFGKVIPPCREAR